MERVVKRLRECAGCNASKRRAGLETCDVEADLAFLQGKLALLGKRATGTQRFHRGSDDGTYTQRDPEQHGRPHRAVERKTNQRPVKARPGTVGSRMGS
jgi:hypothetical protein